jgi:hypothetical protein
VSDKLVVELVAEDAGRIPERPLLRIGRRPRELVLVGRIV